MTTWSDIQYRGFWDVPRIFLTRHHGLLFLFDCPFDEDLDDYPDEYEVFQLPSLDLDNLPKDWTVLSSQSTRNLGRVPIADIQFDPTKRKQIDASILDELLAGVARASG